MLKNFSSGQLNGISWAATVAFFIVALRLPNSEWFWSMPFLAIMVLFRNLAYNREKEELIAKTKEQTIKEMQGKKR